jgi:hypothetical protein
MQSASSGAGNPDGAQDAAPVPFFAERTVAIESHTGAQSPQAVNPFVQNPLPRFPRHVLSYNDASVDGKPVDVQLVTFVLPDRSVLFVMQESSGDDTRAITAINSVRPAK